MNIVIIGFRGTGKTSVSELLAKRLNRKLISTDKIIVEKAKMTIPKIVDKYGWEKFREIESKVIEEISSLNNCVIDAGGGIILNENNIKNLSKNGKFILLSADINTIKKRIEKSSERPSLTGKDFTEEVEDVLEQRKEKYKKAADIEIDTNNKEINEIAEEIIEKLTLK
jgi:shikimate kinase